VALIPWSIDDEPVLLRVKDFDPDYEHYEIVVCDEEGFEIPGARVPDEDSDRLHRAVMEMSKRVEEER